MKRLQIPNSKFLIIGTQIALLIIYSSSNLFSADLLSPTYKMVDPTINTGSTITKSTNFTSKISLSDLTSNPQITSNLYQLKGQELNGFTANVPGISCFETTTDGTSSCTTGPAFLPTGGMTRICGLSGCYDRARFEIDPNTNPIDTLYSIQISELSDFSSYYIVSGTTGAIKTSAAKDISDYKTKTDWETPNINVSGLKSNQLYYLRATALHGDLTESTPSTALSATTSVIKLQFNLEIADVNEVLINNNPPFNISMTANPGLITKADSMIWTTVSSNSQIGIQMNYQGINGGLSNGTSTVITSTTADLTTANTGFGLQKHTSSQWYDPANTGTHGEGVLSTLTIENIFNSNYSSRTDNVGIIPQTPTLQKIQSSTGPIYNGKSGYYVAVKLDTAQPAETLSENLTFVLTTNY